MLPSITMHVLPRPAGARLAGTRRRRLGQSLPNLHPPARRQRRVRTKMNIYLCPVCSKPFPRASARDVHQRILHPWTQRPDGTLESDPGAIEMPFACDKCPKKFPTRTMYFLHRRLHTGRIAQRCERCGKKVFVQRNKIRHTRVPTLQPLVPPFACTCGKTFESKDEVDLHIERRSKGQGSGRCDAVRR